MQKMVQVTAAAYRGETVEGVFELVQDFTAFRGEGRRNGRAGEGFIKVAVAGEQLTRLAPNPNRPVKLTVAAQGEGYSVLSEAFMKTEDELYNEAVELAQQDEVTDELALLKAQFQAAKGRERDALRKRIARREAKLAKPAVEMGVYEDFGGNLDAVVA